MLQDPYAVLRALVRAEAVRNAPKADAEPEPRKPRRQPPKKRERG
ncbi:hypothetical protein ABZ568_12425 [Streptomyces olindensis]|uniref:Uncharacterized protein n=1 Tax=Streptomyces olindensis TaxID=358823 RepID=A0ABV2XT56_9ACTN